MTERGDTIRLATRGSDLAMRQAGTVRELLADRRTDVELVEVSTTGDELRDELVHELGTTGAFVRSLDEQVLDGELDAAVHSMKDMPTDLPAGMVVAGVPQRATAGDVLVTPDGASLEDLPHGATVGTSSLRRKAQLLAERSDLDVTPLRGNVDTRVEKLLAPTLQAEHAAREAAERENEDTAAAVSDEWEGEEFDESVEDWFDGLSEIERRALGREVETEYDAIVLAAAGLERIGLDHHVPTTPLPTDAFVPAPGQGAIAITAVDGATIDRIRTAVDHPRTRVETTVERTILGELGGGCVAPIGIHALLKGSVVKTTVRVLSQDGSEDIHATRELPVERHDQAAVEFAAALADQGADDLIAAAKRALGDGDEAADSDAADPDSDAATVREQREDADDTTGNPSDAGEGEEAIEE